MLVGQRGSWGFSLLCRGKGLERLQQRVTQWGLYFKRSGCNEKKGHLHPNVHGSNIHNTRTMERAEMPINR